MHKITVVPLGPGAPEHLTLGALDTMKNAKVLVLRTARHAAVPYLSEQGIVFETLDDLYLQSEDFDTLASRAAQRLVTLAIQAPLCYAVADPTQDETVQALRGVAKGSVVVMPGVTLQAPLLAACGPQRPLMLSDATHLVVHDAQQSVCITEINSRALAGDCKLQLLGFFDTDSPLYFFPPSQAKGRRVVETTLEELDRQPRYDHTAGALLMPKPPYEKERYDVQDLIAIMRRLRAPDGCPWDKEQTHQSLARYLQEEANEAVAAIAMEDWDALADELGDVLLQVVFHAAVGEDRGTMTFSDITGAICRKLIRRHRHIFGSDIALTAQAVSDNWDKIKEEERGALSAGGKMRALPTSLPPMLRALKTQEAARKVGFDWDDPRDALQKVSEEAAEVLCEYEAGRDVRGEMGDLFFACINTARLMGAFPDEVVNTATEKFINRFEFMENAIEKDQRTSKHLTLQEWDVYWELSKQAEQALL